MYKAIKTAREEINCAMETACVAHSKQAVSVCCFHYGLFGDLMVMKGA